MKILLLSVGFLIVTFLLSPAFAQDINDTLNETEGVSQELGDLLNETEEITNETLKELEKLNQEFEEKLEKVR